MHGGSMVHGRWQDRSTLLERSTGHLRMDFIHVLLPFSPRSRDLIILFVPVFAIPLESVVS